MKKFKNIYNFIIGGVLLSLSFPPFPFFPLAFISFIFILNGIENELKIEKQRFFIKFYLTFFIYHICSNWWISSFQENTDPFLMMAGFSLDIFHPIFFMIPMYAYLKIRKVFSKKISILIFPILWVGWEYFHSIGELSYPWLAVGNTQINNIYLVQIADVCGVWGVSFVVLLVNSLLYLGIEDYTINKKLVNKYLISLISVIVILNIYGFFKFNEYDESQFKNYDKLTISVIQPNIDPWLKWASGPIDQISQNMNIQDSLSYIKKSDLTIWPETSILRINENFNKYKNLSFIENWSKLNGISILSGYIFDYVYAKNEERQSSARFNEVDSVWEESFNSAIMINPDGQFKDVYYKGKLTPFAERIPNLEYFSYLTKFLTWNVGESSWGLGKDKINLKIMKNGKITEVAPIICIESIYPNFCREFTLNGANILSIITNDAWYNGTPGPIQHFNIARMRAIENRRFIARSANSGISGFIAPNGEVISKTENMVKCGLTSEIAILKVKSLYVENGDILGQLLMYLSLMMTIYCIINKRFIR